MEQARNIILAAIRTLDTVEVKGRDNLDKVLGCINGLETAAKIMGSASTADKETGKEAAENG